MVRPRKGIGGRQVQLDKSRVVKTRILRQGERSRSLYWRKKGGGKAGESISEFAEKDSLRSRLQVEKNRKYALKHQLEVSS